MVYRFNIEKEKNLFCCERKESPMSSCFDYLVLCTDAVCQTPFLVSHSYLTRALGEKTSSFNRHIETKQEQQHIHTAGIQIKTKVKKTMVCSPPSLMAAQCALICSSPSLMSLSGP